MAFSIKHGLFQYDLTDHHAVLGVSVTADPGTVRKRYLKLARLLHPDSLRNASEEDKRQASELLSKLVNPAYEVLKGKARNEHQIVLEQTGKRLASEGGTPKLNSDIAQSFLKAGGDANSGYTQALNAIAKKQYRPIGSAIATIEILSELNLVYLMKQGGKGVRSTAPKTPSNTAKPSGKTTTARPTAANNAPPPPATPSSPVERYIARAQEYITKNNFAKAVLELRDGLKLDPKNSACHAMLGMAYLKQDQISMAKVHVTKALQSNPNEPIALQCKTVLEKKLGKPLGVSSSSAKSSGKSTGKSARTSGSRKTDKSQSGGRFGGLFGNKNK
ncbi:MAG: DnaJ domain-containing protein [Spirulina sp. SIO3F2]|nr:DnaJ domain-containing protein [Spirulina sp. SIO3F2]